MKCRYHAGYRIIRDPMTYLEVFLSGSSVNNTEYANPEYDALIKKIKTELGNDERLAGKQCKMLKNAT